MSKTASNQVEIKHSYLCYDLVQIFFVELCTKFSHYQNGNLSDLKELWITNFMWLKTTSVTSPITQKSTAGFFHWLLQSSLMCQHWRLILWSCSSALTLGP